MDQPGALGILIDYPRSGAQADASRDLRTIPLESQGSAPRRGVTIGFVGSGNYASGVLIPAFKAAGARLRTVASIGGVSGVHAGRKFGFEQATTDVESVIADPSIDAVVIATRHDSHARLVEQALAAGKHVFVEKPLALTLDQIAGIERQYASMNSAPMLMVGFNRRFAPHIQKMNALLGTVKEPKAISIVVNAGAIAPDHWTQNREIGGGRIIGEACHFIDLLRYLIGAPISSFQAASFGDAPGVQVSDDKASITLQFEDGSLGNILYFANGHKSLPKERVEIFAAGRVLQLNNFRTLTGFGWPGFRRMRLWRQDKGQRACTAAFVRALNEGGASPIPFDEVLEVSRVAVEVAESLR